MRESVIGANLVRDRIQTLELEESDLNLQIQQAETALTMLLNERNGLRSRIRELKSLLDNGDPIMRSGYDG